MKNLFSRVYFSVSTTALIALLIGLTLTTVAFVSMRRAESEMHNQQFRTSANIRIATVRGGLVDAIEQLRIVNQLFQVVGIVSAEQFHDFSAPLLQRYPQLQALSFQRTVTHAERFAYEAARRRSDSSFRITEMTGDQVRTAAIRPTYNVVDYIEPLAGNEAAVGLDTAVTSDQTAARRRSRASGEPTATGLLSIAQHKGWHTAFLVIAPVYRTGMRLDSVAQRDAAIIGETAAVFRVDNLIDTILDAGGVRAEPGMVMSIFASAVADPAQLAFREGHAGTLRQQSFPFLPYWLLVDRADPVAETFALAGSIWRMEVAQAEVSFLANYNASLFVLLGGILSSLLAAAYVYSLVSRDIVAERMIGERTVVLRTANLRLSEDLAQHVRTESALRLHERAIQVSPNAILICAATGPDYAIEYVNPAFERITGYCKADVLGRGLESMQGNGVDQQNLDEIRTCLREVREGHALLRNFRKDGTGYWSDLFIAPVRDEKGIVIQFVFAQYDVSSIMRFEAELAYQTRHDTLTGLANRMLFTERLTQATQANQGDGAKIWVLFVDLDRFKFVNDTLGHEAGDELLKVLAARLQSAAAGVDTVARVGGDEFLVLLNESPDDGTGMAALRSIMDAVVLPLQVQGYEFILTCSIGVAVHPTDGDTAETLIKHADIAMYRAKELGRNTFQFYTRQMSERSLDRLNLETDLRYALERDEFVLHYQPQVSLRDGRIVGMEALIRWNHPLLGLIPPVRFIGLAEDMGLIIPIGLWVARTACLQVRAWQRAGFGELRVAVNLSPRQFMQKGLVQSIATVLSETGLAARYLELELTESMVMTDVDNAIAILGELKNLGVPISIDDFGTGYSSLSYLRRFPLDVLKIDRSFTNDVTSDANNAAIVVSIIALAHNLQLKVIAEGVETAEQLAFLRQHGCDQIQGYYFSRPVAAPDFEQLLHQGRCLPMLASL
jgi:diguanylate cyclase (GGDEF)-like protein/PAS domain S-box-containing protein